MPAITAAVLGGVGTAVGLASAGMSFGQAAKQRQAQQEAQKEAEKAMAEAKKALSVNYYKGLSIQKEPYELEREGLAQAGAQAMEAARESERSVAPTAGRVQMAQQAGQRQIAAAMGQEMSGLEKLTAEEESRLRDARAQLDLEQAAGAQLAAADAAKAQQQAMAQGFAGLTGAMSTAAGMTDKLYATKNTPETPASLSEMPKPAMPQTYNVTPGINQANLIAAQGVTQIPQTSVPMLPDNSISNNTSLVTPVPPAVIVPRYNYSLYSPFNRQGYGIFGDNFSSVTGR